MVVKLLNIPIGLVALIWGARVLPETNRDPSARRPDIVGSVAITVTTSVLALLIVKGSEWGWSSPIILALIGSTIFGTGFLAQRIMRHPDPVLPKGLLAIRSFRVAIASLFLFGLGFFSSMLTVVLYFDDIANYSTVRAGFGISVLAVMAFTTANFSGRLADRFGYRRVLIPGMCLFILGCLWLYQNAGTDPNFVVDVFPALLLMGLGIGSGPTLLSAAAVSEVEQSDFSVAGAVAQTSRQLSGAIGISIAVVIIGDAADPNSFRSAFLFLAFVVMLAAFLASRLHSSN